MGLLDSGNGRYSKIKYNIPSSSTNISSGNHKSKKKIEFHSNSSGGDGSSNNGGGGGNMKRQQSMPSKLPSAMTTSASSVSYQQKAGFDQKKNSVNYKVPVKYEECPRLDEDDIDNFIPNADLAYNEFMPEGPSGYQCNISTSDNSNQHLIGKSAVNSCENGIQNNAKKKRRRLSSPAFFKTNFTRSLKGKISSSMKPKSGHASTSWEWYRLKKSSTGIPITANTTTNALSLSSNASMDSSLSELNFPTNSTQNSFRILEEAILSSEMNNNTGASLKSLLCTAHDNNTAHRQLLIYNDHNKNGNSSKKIGDGNSVITKRLLCNGGGGGKGGKGGGLMISDVSNGGITSSTSSNSNRSINSNYNANSTSNSSLNANSMDERNVRKKSANSFYRIFRKIF